MKIFQLLPATNIYCKFTSEIFHLFNVFLCFLNEKKILININETIMIMIEDIKPLTTTKNEMIWFHIFSLKHEINKQTNKSKK